MPPKVPSGVSGNVADSKGKGLPTATSAAGVESLNKGELSDISAGPQKRRKQRNKRRKSRRPSFISQQSDENEILDSHAERPGLEAVPERQVTQTSFYRLGNVADVSGESIESEALLDHRTQHSTRHRRQSAPRNSFAQRPNLLNVRPSSHSQPKVGLSRIKTLQEPAEISDVDTPDNDRTPLISNSQRSQLAPRRNDGYGAVREPQPEESYSHWRRRQSAESSPSGRRALARNQSSHSLAESYDVNNPPSQPGSPRLGPDEEFDDVMLPEFHSGSPTNKSGNLLAQDRDAIIDIDQDNGDRNYHAGPRSPGVEIEAGHRRKGTGTSPVEDVCVPFDLRTEMEDDDYLHRQTTEDARQRRPRKREWPDLQALEEWAQTELEGQPIGDVRAKKVSEPVMIGGRLRPQKGGWSREVEEAPFRWTYFNEELDSSIRSHSLSGLQQLGLNFRELFIPNPPELEDSSADENEDDDSRPTHNGDGTVTPSNAPSRSRTRQSSLLDYRFDKKPSSGEHTPQKSHSTEPKPKRYGPRPVFWLDVLCPTYEEMRMLSRAFGIHKLTAEDIMEQEAREKVELFRNYYFVNYRTFEQDEDNEDFMDPVNMYFTVFKGGVISFHFSQMPHPANVRRRIRQLAEHQYTDSDWIAYALIDNITDAYAPIIEQIETEVDSIDDEILASHSKEKNSPPQTQLQAKAKEKVKKKMQEKVTPMYEKMVDETEALMSGETSKDMLLRVGECRKKVMGMYRLLGNKADVIKGLAKRCNEQWEVAPRSDVGLYLGDIQDHIVTMTGNLTHYENILARAHSNYLAQINIGMNERAEQTNDVLGKLTVLGTIVVPMNIVTGIWGMNCLVPGQDVDNYGWFFAIVGGLLAFGIGCYYIAKRVYHLV